MSVFDKAKDVASKSKDKVAEGVGKATGVIDDKTGGKYSDHLKKVDDVVGKVTGKSGSDVSAEPTSDDAGDGQRAADG